MAITLNGTTGITTPGTDSTTLTVNANNISASNSLGFRNRIINGNMVIDQRNNGASITQQASSTFSVDRWSVFGSVTSKFSIQQNAGSVTPPIGFTKYIGATSLSSYSVGASEIYIIQQVVEGFNISDFNWGTANAVAITVSFRVYSSLTGTFGGVITNGGSTRSYPFSFSISSANTWTTVSIPVVGDTSGTWATDNTAGLKIIFSLGSGASVSGAAGAWAGAAYFSATGATSVVGTNGATFYITGVQLEAGSVATPFERIDYGRQLMQCQRYLPAWASSSTVDPIANGAQFGVTTGLANFVFPVQTRVPPTGLIVSSASHFAYNAGSGSVTPSAVTFGSASTKLANVNFTIPSSGAVGYAATVYFVSTSGNIYFTGCEL